MSRFERRVVAGPAGRMELGIDWPEGPPRGLAGVGHPHPLYGGTLDNKVAATLARSLAACGYVALRPNFRGVGESEGGHDGGQGETTDFLALLDEAASWPELAALGGEPPLALAGFSFGSFVVAKMAQALAARGRPVDPLILVGSAAGKWPMPAVAPGTLVIHGEVDETIALAAVLDWARPQALPVVVIPGADHFFHRRLTLMRDLVLRHIRGGEATAKFAAGDRQTAEEDG